MKDPNFETFEARRKRAVEIGNADDTSAHGELLSLLGSPYPIVRKSAAGALVKIHAKHPSFAASARFILMDALLKETGEQIRQYMLRALLPAAGELNAVDCENLHDIARHRVAYRYDERIRLAGDLAIRPDFYLPEFDVYIEYWGWIRPSMSRTCGRSSSSTSGTGRSSSPFPGATRIAWRSFLPKSSRAMRRSAMGNREDANCPCRQRPLSADGESGRCELSVSAAPVECRWGIGKMRIVRVGSAC